MVQEEVESRQEVQSKLAEQRKDAERERKALREELEGKLRAARKEIADLKAISKVLHFSRQCLLFLTGSLHGFQLHRRTNDDT